MAESDLIRGNVDTVILKVLYEGDRYGYDLIKQINARSDGQWEIKQPTVYACLKRLEKQGFVSSYWDSSDSDGGRRKYYSLTESGKEVFIKYKNEFERASALFGGIISGGESVFIQPVDDYSDVEDEGYSVPKRRSPRQKRNAPEKAKQDAQSDDEQEQIITQPDSNDTANEQPDYEQGQAAPTYVQQDLFSIAQEQERQAVYEQDNYGSYTEQTTEREVIDEQPSARTALDPRSIIDRYYASETGESYSDVHGKTVYTEQAASSPTKPQQAAPTVEREEVSSANAPAVAQATEPAPVEEKQKLPVVEQPQTAPKIASNEAMLPLGFEDESPARKEYKTVLSDLVERFEVASPDVRSRVSAPAEEQAAVSGGANVAEKRFFKVTQAARDLGDEVTIKNHNDSAKQYTHKYYYYSNRLMMTHYTVMCLAMLIIGGTLFFTFYSGLGMRIRYDYLLYIATGLLPIAMFITAVICFAIDPDKKKRINVNFRSSMIIRTVIMIQVAVVIYCLNLIWGMPVGFSAAYVPSLVIPLAYALFIPVSEVIFMTLLKSERYAVE